MTDAPQPAPAADDNDRPSASAAAPPLDPLFTLVTNASNNTTSHPRVHYIFSDDDPSAILSATTDRSIVVDLALEDDPASSAQTPRWSVSCASSLTDAFAVTDAHLGKRPSPQDQQDQPAQTPRRAAEDMLYIEGVQREPVRDGGGDEASAPGLDGLVDEFHRRMGVINRVVAQAHKRQAPQDVDRPDHGGVANVPAE